MTREEFQTERTRIISEMLDNPDEYGIYPTTKCFEQLDALFDSLSLPPAEGAEQRIRVRNILQDFYRRGEYELEQAEEDIMRLFQQQPTAEGAEEILLLAKYISQIRVINDPDIDQLLKLDDLWKEVYAEHRIKIGFGEASLIAYAAVIKKVRALHAQRIAEKMVSERLREELIRYIKWYGGFNYENMTDEMLVNEYLKTRESHD